MSNTPETDTLSKECYQHQDIWETIRQMRKLAEKLERERDEARKLAVQWRGAFWRDGSAPPGAAFPWEDTEEQG